MGTDILGLPERGSLSLIRSWAQVDWDTVPAQVILATQLLLGHLRTPRPYSRIPTSGIRVKTLGHRIQTLEL